MPDRPRPEPRLLRREDAALYAGIGATLFDRLVSEGKMPQPVRIEGRVLWDRWSTLKQVELYTRKADQRRLARGAMAKLVSKEQGR